MKQNAAMRLFAASTLFFAASLCLAPLTAQTGGPGAPAGADAIRTDPAYRLNIDDVIAISVYGEPELGTAQKIDTDGEVRLALIGDIRLAGKSVREAERYLEQLYIERKLLRRPLVTISVQAYSPRDIMILGAVRSPGNIQLPPSRTSIDIVEFITQVGGFTPTARGDAVRITRPGPDGKEITFEINVEAMITGRGRTADTPREFALFPGDRLFVRERVF
jgi:polysaccharide export outer membrane protein